MAETVKKVCPECGQDMSVLDPVGHALSHWPENIPPNKINQTAIQRQTKTLAGGVTVSEYQKAHEEG